ncbi:MAG TPA: PQQ-binding-like beta-propeller repeat protein [Candidatus Sulfotelmatobacter sp.]|nr:PQQ-binding-like beta-propeller repeat protein [Candidatus Sulfotelmatobacter sp.]
MPRPSRVSIIFSITTLCLAAAMVVISSTLADSPAKVGNVNAARVAADADGVNWLLNGRTFDSGHFSPLKQINDQNVSGLGLAWYMDVDSAMGIVSEPIVVDGVAYVSAPQSKVYAVDAATGKLIWKFDPKIRLDQALNGSYSARTNAGVAVWEGKVFVGTGDCRLIGIDAATGKQIWEALVCEPTQTGITNAPHVAKGMVFMGYNGSDDGVRGAIAAYDANTGKELWRFWTVPGDPQKPFESKALKEIAAKTWPGGDAWKMGGADVWTAITYDPVTDFVIFGTAGAGADYGELTALRAGGDKLFAGCIVAVKATTGEYIWHYQTSSPGLQTENNHILMADLPIKGEKHHVAMTVPKNGFYYILDAWTGKLLSAKPIVKLNWATSIDLATGKAVEVPASQGGGKQWTVHNWWPMSYDAGTGLVYIPATDRKPDTHSQVETGEWMQQTEGRLIAWDPVNQSERWSVEEEIATNGGVLSTAGNLVFQGQGNGEFAAYTADTGKKVWSIDTGSAIESIPVTYSVNGEQYVLLPVGWGSGSRLFAPGWTMATPRSKRGPSRLLAFKLAGKIPFPTPPDIVPPVPKPPAQTADAATIKEGEKLYKTFYCDGCHSPHLDGSGAWVENGAIPDLRYAPPEVHEGWYAIVLGGTHWRNGMPGFLNPPKFAFPTLTMTPQQADAIHAYVIDGAWKAYRGEHPEEGSDPAHKK